MLREKSLKNQRPRVDSTLLHSKVQKKCMYLFYVLGVLSAYIYLFITRVPDARGGQASDPLDPELQMVVGHHVGARN